MSSAQDADDWRPAEQIPDPVIDHHQDVPSNARRYHVCQDQREHGTAEE
jgi:hypothetical protein